MTVQEEKAKQMDSIRREQSMRSSEEEEATAVVNIKEEAEMANRRSRSRWSRWQKLGKRRRQSQ